MAGLPNRIAQPSLILALAGLLIAGCTSSQDVLEPSALLSSNAANPLPQAPFPAAAGKGGATDAPTQLSAINSSARIRFAPIVGATPEASTPLATRISARASARGITLTGAEDSSASHILKGYFSAISEAGGTTVIYVWDVMDPSGTRIHRLQGQAKSPGGNGQGWTSVQNATMEAIADHTVDQLAAWLASRQG